MSAGTLSQTYTKMLNLIRNPESLKERSTGRKKGKRPSGDSNISNYFLSQDRRTASPSNTRAAGKLREIIEIDEDDDDFENGIDEEVREFQEVPYDDGELEMGEGVEKEKSSDCALLQELLPEEEEEDSGMFSLCSSPPSIQRLIDHPPTRKELQEFDLSVAIEKALAKFGIKKRPPVRDWSLLEDKTELEVPQSLIVCPVDNNDSLEDMFADDDSFSEFFNSVNNQKVENEDVAVSNFNLGSPVIESEEGDIKDEDLANVENAETDFAASNFDLGSPVIEVEKEEEFEKNECLPKNSGTDIEASNFDLGSPVIEVEEEDMQKNEDFANPQIAGTDFAASNFDLGSPVIESAGEEDFKNDEDLAKNAGTDFGHSNFELGSPVIEVEEEQIPAVLHPLPDSPRQSEPNVGANFDLGSPVIEGQDIVKSNFDINSPVRADFEVRRELKYPKMTSNTSTPIIPWSKKSVSTEPKPPVNNQMNESEDMFGDSEDDHLFLEAEDNYNKKGENNETLYDTTALLDMMNGSKTRLERTYETPVKKPKKLTTIFDNISTNNESAGHEEFNNKSHHSEVKQAGRSREGEKRDKSVETQSNGSTEAESVNLLSDYQEDNEEENEVENEVENETENNVCPVCNARVPGDMIKFNEHLDICLNAGVIQELTQSDGQSYSRLQRSPDTSPIISKKSSRRVIASQSVQSVQGEVSTSSEESLLCVRKKSKGGGRQFIDSEADLSGGQASEDEAELSGDHYDQSFVDDASQAVDHAVYLQSVKSPEFRKPFSRPLPPITDDIFSQPVHDSEDDFYEEDSFCVGDSMVELDSCQDTLDLLEQEAEDADRGGRRRKEDVTKQKRKRIVLNSSSEESIDNMSLVETKKRKRIIMAPSDDETVHVDRPSSPEPLEVSKSSIADEEPQAMSPVISQRRIRPQASSSVCLSEPASEGQKTTVIFNSGEVGKSQEVVSSLRYIHGFRVLVQKCQEVSVVSGRHSAILRIPEQEFNVGTGKEKLTQRLHQVGECYSEVLIIVELERKKAGDRARKRTKQQDLTVSQLGLANVKVLFSPGLLETADIIARVTRLAEERGEALPREELTARQQREVRWLQDIPGLGLGTALTLAVSFPSLRALICSSRERLVQRGADQRTAERLFTFFNEAFNPKLTELAPL